MQVGYRFFRCNAEGDVTTALVVFPDGKHFECNPKGDIGAYFTNVLSIEVPSVKELKRILGKLQSLGLIEVDLGCYMNASVYEEFPYDESSPSLNVGFLYGANTNCIAVFPEQEAYLVTGINTQVGRVLDLVVEAKRNYDVEGIEITVSRHFWFKPME
jgi:hypothetical protein